MVKKYMKKYSVDPCKKQSDQMDNLCSQVSNMTKVNWIFYIYPLFIIFPQIPAERHHHPNTPQKVQNLCVYFNKISFLFQGVYHQFGFFQFRGRNRTTVSTYHKTRLFSHNSHNTHTYI